MRGLGSVLAGCRDALAGWARKTDWPLVTIVLGFVLAVYSQILPTGLLSGVTRLFRSAPFASYEQAIEDAAVKTPSEQVPLKPIAPDAPEVLITTFSPYPYQPGVQPPPLPRELWVTLPDELRAACAGKEEPGRALRQILGLPPTSERRMVYELSVPTAQVFRPCISGPDIKAPTCSFERPPEPPETADPRQ